MSRITVGSTVGVDNTAKAQVTIGLSKGGQPVVVRKKRIRGFEVLIEGGGVQPPAFEGTFLSFEDARLVALVYITSVSGEDEYPEKDLF